jgi:hypothetical protein
MGYLIYSMQVVVYDMLYFLLIFFIVILGSATAFYTLSANYEQGFVDTPM